MAFPTLNPVTKIKIIPCNTLENYSGRTLVSYIYNRYYNTESPTKQPTYIYHPKDISPTPCYIIVNNTIIREYIVNSSIIKTPIEGNYEGSLLSINIKIIGIIVSVLLLYYCVDIPVFIFLFILKNKK